jgi:hypothetical protein
LSADRRSGVFGPLSDLKTRVQAALALGAWGGAAILAAAISAGFFCAALFLWVAREYDAITAALILGALFLLVAAVPAIVCLILRRRRPAAAPPQPQWWQEPAVLLAGLEVVRIVGARRLLPIAIVGGVLAGLISGQANDRRAPPQADQ